MANILPQPVQQLINNFARLPGVGPKTASRLTFYLLRGTDKSLAADLAAALLELGEKTRYCSRCFNITENDPCEVCADESRDETVLCVVEEPLDVVAIERSRAYTGLYHVLHGALSPIEGIGPDDLRIEELVQRIDDGAFNEVILATNATLEGDSTALYLQRRLAGSNARLTRLARGLSVGGDIEYTDEITLSRALNGRQEMH
ncbi:MAG: recombination mediator RecR [Anaerolineae bacterium]|nr:recombination mediator RecR [Anaerolineae bacterium]MCO5207046.1 recombination mediator RecR [Anaerolineae bacterium]